MKTADKIKTVLSTNPEVVHNRARIRAMYYIEKNSPKRYFTATEVEKDGTLMIFLHEKDSHIGPFAVATVACLPLNRYFDNGRKI